MAKSYWQLLRDPRWQRKRLEIMQRDDFKCRKCRDGTTTLNVHHSYYVRGCMPWEYPDSSLVTWCEKCHGEFEAIKKQINAAMQSIPTSRLGIVLGFVKMLVLAADDDYDAVIDVPTISEQIGASLACQVAWKSFMEHLVIAIDRSVSYRDAWDVDMVTAIYLNATMLEHNSIKEEANKTMREIRAGKGGE